DYLDERAGIFGRIDEQHSSQLPLRISRVIVNLTLDTRCGSVGRPVFAAGWDFESARMAAMRRAIETYAAAAIDPRRMHRGNGDVWGLDLHGGMPVSVSAPDLLGDRPDDDVPGACGSVASA